MLARIHGSVACKQFISCMYRELWLHMCSLTFCPTHFVTIYKLV